MPPGDKLFEGEFEVTFNNLTSHGPTGVYCSKRIIVTAMSDQLPNLNEKWLVEKIGVRDEHTIIVSLIHRIPPKYTVGSGFYIFTGGDIWWEILDKGNTIGYIKIDGTAVRGEIEGIFTESDAAAPQELLIMVDKHTFSWV